MERIIELDILEQDDLLEKYNRKKLSRKLVNYIIGSIPYIGKNDTIKLVINSRIDNIECIPVIVEGLKHEYEKSMKRHFYNNIIQIIYLIVGIIMIFLSTIIEGTILKEIFLIGGWVFIWEFIEIEIFTDTKGLSKRRLLKKILNSQMIENKIEDQ